MAAKTKKSAASEKPNAPTRTPKQHQYQPSPPRQQAGIIKHNETLLMDPAIVAAEHPHHRANQPYQGHQQYGHFQPARSISTSEYPNYSTAQSGPTQSVLSSPYLGSGGPVQQQPQASSGEPSFYNPHPSPRSTQGASGPYYPPDTKPDSMAVATAHMQRPYPPIYHTPQSASPASVSSPQTHDHGRPMYSHQQAPIPPQMYSAYPYNQPPMNTIHQPAYSQHPSQNQYPHQIQTQSMPPYQANTPQMSNTQTPIHSATVSSSPRMKQEPAHQYAQQPQQRTPHLPQHVASAPVPASGNLPQTQSGPPTQNSNAAPGPIPATTPLVVRRDNNGVQWISFEYSRDRVKMEYTIRCDVESVNTENLSQDFKAENCVYPRACVPKEQYKGNRLNYETDCNQVGWSLAELNPCLRSKRGLIQRAVDSWRNSNSDQRLRSRRVRRQAKMNTRSKQQVNQPPGPSGPISAGLPSQTSGPNYSTVPQGHQQIPNHPQMSSPSDIRQGQVFPGGYPPYPPAPSSMAPSMAPSLAGTMPPQYGRPPGNTMASEVRDEEDSLLFGDLPEGKRRKFILVEDLQKQCKVRVKVMLDQVEMSEIPDSFRKQNAVHQRSYFPVQMPDQDETNPADRFVSSKVEADDLELPTIGRTTVPIRFLDGEDDIEVPQLTRAKRDKEEKLNELGYRMAWGQSRAFAGRTMFLQKSLDAYRNKQRSTLLASGQEIDQIPAHLETRPGKRRWLERSRSNAHTTTPPVTLSE